MEAILGGWPGLPVAVFRQGDRPVLEIEPAEAVFVPIEGTVVIIRSGTALMSLRAPGRAHRRDACAARQALFGSCPGARLARVRATCSRPPPAGSTTPGAYWPSVRCFRCRRRGSSPGDATTPRPVSATSSPGQATGAAMVSAGSTRFRARFSLKVDLRIAERETATGRLPCTGDASRRIEGAPEAARPQT